MPKLWGAALSIPVGRGMKVSVGTSSWWAQVFWAAAVFDKKQEKARVRVGLSRMGKIGAESISGIEGRQSHTAGRDTPSPYPFPHLTPRWSGRALQPPLVPRFRFRARLKPSVGRHVRIRRCTMVEEQLAPLKFGEIKS